jgi:hypothetical protein
LNKRGRPSRTSYTIERFNAASKDKTEALLSPGQVVIAETKDGRRTFSLKDGELNRDAQIVLGLILGLSDSKYNEDELFGTKNAKGTNSSWEANSAVLADEFKAAKLKLTKDDIKNSFKIIGEISLTNTVPPLPSSMKVKASTGTITYAWIVPADTTKRLYGEIRTSKMSNEIDGKTPDGQSMEMSSAIDQRIEIRYDK